MGTNLVDFLGETYSSGSMPEIFDLIEELHKRLKQFQGKTLKEAGLTPPQYFILTLLAKKDRRPFKELAELLTCSRATVTGIVDTMERKGLVGRSPHPDDRRSLLVILTEKGLALIQATPELDETFGGCCCDLLSPKEFQELSKLLRKVSIALPF